MPRLALLLTLLGLSSLLPYLAAQGLGDLREHTNEFVIAFGAAFILYLLAVRLILHPSNTQYEIRNTLLLLAFALLFRLILLPTRPALSDDMFRYVWDGRVQASGISPYRYPPNANVPEIARLRGGDRAVSPLINRKGFVTVYPPFAQMTFAALWRMVGDSVTGFKAAFVLAELAAGAVLLVILRLTGQPLTRILIYAWSPLLIFEVAHAGHLDGVMLLLLCAAFLARLTDHDGLLGVFLGAAITLKFLPLLLLPALLPLPPDLLVRLRRWHFGRRLDTTRRLACPDIGGGGTTGGSVDLGLGRAFKVLVVLLLFAGGVYLPYILWGANVIGFLPVYFGENFNLGLARLVFMLAEAWNVVPSTLSNTVTFGGLAVIALACVLRPAATGREALARCIWLIGWFTLFTQNLFAWYFLWALPLLTLFVMPGRWGFRLDMWTAWLVFSGTVAFSYLFFANWQADEAAQLAEYLPLYALLLAAGARTLWMRWQARPQASLQQLPHAS